MKAPRMKMALRCCNKVSMWADFIKVNFGSWANTIEKIQGPEKNKKAPNGMDRYESINKMEN